MTKKEIDMIKIGLFCAAGFSTGMLVNNMKVAAEKKRH